MRAVRFEPGYVVTAEGSALIEFGSTRVLCAATVEDGVPSWMRGSGRGWVSAEYAMLPRSTATRTPREVNKGRQSGRTMEIQRLIGRALRAVVDLDALGERSIIVDCDVIQADGGTRTASITGGYVALALAVRQLIRYKQVLKDPLRDQVAAVSVGVVDGSAVLDLNYDEDASAHVDMNVVMTGGGKFVEVQATGERDCFDDNQLASMLALARKGISELLEAQREVISRR
jgi:ribonuclease PH